MEVIKMKFSVFIEGFIFLVIIWLILIYIIIKLI